MQHTLTASQGQENPMNAITKLVTNGYTVSTGIKFSSSTYSKYRIHIDLKLWFLANGHVLGGDIKIVGNASDNERCTLEGTNWGVKTLQELLDFAGTQISSDVPAAGKDLIASIIDSPPPK
jgi:hypothetical protein